MDLLGATYDEKVVCKDNDSGGIHKCLPLQGKSLANVVLGADWQTRSEEVMIPMLDTNEGRGGRRGKGNRGGKGKKGAKGEGVGKGKGRGGKKGKTRAKGGGNELNEERGEERRLAMENVMAIESTRVKSSWNESTSMDANALPLEPLPLLERDFAVTQSWRCAPKKKLTPDPQRRGVFWTDCSRDDNENEKGRNEVSVMGYSMRTSEFRYTAWVHFNRSIMAASWDKPLFAEELYDHRGETLKDYTHQELENIAQNPSYYSTLVSLRSKLLDYLKVNLVFHGPYPKPK